MTQQLDQLLTHLRAMTVAVVTNVITDNRNIICFCGKNGQTVWDDEPAFEQELARFTRDEWRKVEKTYSEYYGFAEIEMMTEKTRTVFFRMCDYAQNYCRFDVSYVLGENSTPPQYNDLIVGVCRIYPDNRRRFHKWVKFSPSEAKIRQALLSGEKLEERILLEMEKIKSARSVQLVNFARLVVNGNIAYYLAEKRKSVGDKAEMHMRRSMIDDTVFITTRGLCPDLWTKYVELSQAEKLYSDHIPKPASKSIRDNLGGYGVPVGLSTPFVSFEMSR